MLDRLDGLPAIETPRLRIRPLVPHDAAALQAISDNPEILDAIVFLPRPFGVADAERLIRGKGDGRDCFAGLWSKADGVLSGVVGVHLQGADRIEIGYWVWPERHGHGLATEAAGAVVESLRRLAPERSVVARAFEHNPRSRRVLRKLGFLPAEEAGWPADPLLFVLA